MRDDDHGRIGRYEYDEAQRRKASAAATFVTIVLYAAMLLVAAACFIIPTLPWGSR